MSNSGRCVIVTGGSRGLGLSLIRHLLGQGYDVATCSRKITSNITALRSELQIERFMWSECNVGTEEQESRYFSEVLKWAGDREIYGLVNNAGIAMDGILATFPNSDSTRIIEINLIGALRMARLALRNMLSNKHGGRIINISSIIGSRGYTGLASYSASKAGMDGLTRALAREVGRRNITVNSVAPGYLDTEMSSTLQSRQRQQIIGRTPMARLGTAEDVVPVIAFLLGDDSRFVTGQTIIVDGGITC